MAFCSIIWITILFSSVAVGCTGTGKWRFCTLGGLDDGIIGSILGYDAQEKTNTARFWYTGKSQ